MTPQVWVVLVVMLLVQFAILYADEQRMKARGWPITRMSWIAVGQMLLLVVASLVVVAMLPR